MAYTFDRTLLNELESPVEDITEEIQDEAEEHQFFFTGSVEDCSYDIALAHHEYLDEDSNGLPLGLTNTITTLIAGTRELTISLRHLPEEDGQTVKTESMATDVCNGTAIPGDWDVRVTFPLTVTE